MNLLRGPDRGPPLPPANEIQPVLDPRPATPGSYLKDLETTTFFRGLLSYMWLGERKVSKDDFFDWIRSNTTRGTLIRFKREQIDKPERHNDIRGTLNDFAKLKNLKGKIKLLSQQTSTRSRDRPRDTPQDRLLNRWIEYAHPITRQEYGIPGVRETTKSDEDCEWRWRAAWALLFTVLKDLQHDKAGYFAQLLGGPSLFELKLQRQPVVPRKTPKPLAPRNTLFGRPASLPPSKSSQRSTGSAPNTASMPPRINRTQQVDVAAKTLEYRNTSRRSKRAGKGIQKGKANKAAREEEQKKRKREESEAAEEEGVENEDEFYYRRDRTKRAMYFSGPIRRAVEE